MLVATAIATAAKGAGDYMSGQNDKKAAKRRAKETKRETYANLFDEALGRGGELEGHRLQSRNRLGKRSTQSMLDSSDLIRGALGA